MTMTISKPLVFAALLTLGVSPSFAQDHKMEGMPGMNMPGMGMQNMKGMHMMPATVTVIDATTGLTDVDAGGMKLRLHFPPTSLADVKAGDKITLHLSFTKP
jgi:hypothetical protein